MRNQPLPLPLGFYASEDRPFSQQDVWNYLPCKAEAPGARSSLMLKTPPGLYPWAEVAGAPPVRGIHDCEGKLFAVIGTTLYRLSPTGVAIPYGTIPGNGRVSMDHNQRARGQQLTIVNGAAGYVLDTVGYDLQRITDAGFPGSPVIRFLDGFMVGIDPAGRFAFNSDAANATEYNTLNRWTSEYRPDRLVSMGRLGGEMLLLSASSGEFFGNTGAAQQPFRSKRIFIDKGCAGPHTVVEADNTVFWLGSDGHFYQLDGYNPRRISTRPIEQAIRGQDGWNAFGFVWESEGHTVVYWTFLNGQTWGWDTSQQQWHRRESYGLDRWRVSCTARSAGQWYAGDFQVGRIWRIDWGYPWEGDTEFASGFTVPVIHDNQNELIHSRLELVMDTGMPAVEPAQFRAQPAGPTVAGAAPDGAEAEPYAGYAYTVTPGDAAVSSVRLIQGVLPPGLTWDEANRSIEHGGVPEQAGEYGFVIRAEDVNGKFADLTDVINIDEEPFDPYFNYVVLLLHGEGADGSTAFVDSSKFNKTPSAVVGTAQITTVEPVVGEGSLLFNADGWISYGADADIDLGAEDFTIEAVVQRTEQLAGEAQVLIERAAPGGASWRLYMNQYGGSLGFQTSAGFTLTSPVLGSQVANPCAVSVVRKGEEFEMYVEDIHGQMKRVASAASSATLSSDGQVNIGAEAGWSTGRLQGRLDELRVTKGVARYTGEYPRPSMPFPSKGPDADVLSGEFPGQLEPAP